MKKHKCVWDWVRNGQHIADIKCRSCGAFVPGKKYEEIVAQGRNLYNRDCIGDWLRKEFSDAAKSS